MTRYQARGQSAVGTLVERSTRYAGALPNGHTAVEVQDAIIDKLMGLPDSLRLSLTWDQGSGESWLSTARSPPS